MIPQATPQDRMRSILILVATIATIAFNAQDAAWYLNGVTHIVISDTPQTVLTPAAYAFTICAPIYIGLLAFSIYQLLPGNVLRFRPVRTLYVVSCFLNCAWIYFWHRGQITICLFLIIGLLMALIFMLILFRRPGADGGPLFTKTVFGIYAGWVTAAALVNFAIFLRYMGGDISVVVWNVFGVVCLVLVAGLAVLVRLKLQNYLYPLAIAWAATAIAVKQSGNTAIVVAASICVIVGLVMAVSFVMDQKSTTS
jgi:translocator protein